MRKIHIAFIFFCIVTLCEAVQKTTFRERIEGDFCVAMTSTQKFMLFLGWSVYWLKKLIEHRALVVQKGDSLIEKIKDFIETFIVENFFEVPLSAIYCIVLIFMAPEIPASLVDVKGLISLFAYGAGGSSIINEIITKSKPK